MEEIECIECGAPTDDLDTELCMDCYYEALYPGQDV